MYFSLAKCPYNQILISFRKTCGNNSFSCGAKNYCLATGTATSGRHKRDDIFSNKRWGGPIYRQPKY